MKILSLLSTIILALSLSGAASAEVTGAPEALAISSYHRCAADAPCDHLVQRDGQAAAQGRQPVARVDDAPLSVPKLETSLMFMLGLLILGVTSRRRSSERFDR